MTYSVSETVSMFHNTATSKVTGGSVAEGSARLTHSLVVPGSSPALASYWICSWWSQVQILGHTSL